MEGDVDRAVAHARGHRPEEIESGRHAGQVARDEHGRHHHDKAGGLLHPGLPGLLTALIGVAPAGDPDGLAGREAVRGSGQADGPHGAAVLHGLLQLQHCDVVVVGEVVEEGVADDAFEFALLHPWGVTLALVMQTQEGGPHGMVGVPVEGAPRAPGVSAPPRTKPPHDGGGAPVWPPPPPGNYQVPPTPHSPSQPFVVFLP